MFIFYQICLPCIGSYGDYIINETTLTLLKVKGKALNVGNPKENSQLTMELPKKHNVLISTALKNNLKLFCGHKDLLFHSFLHYFILSCHRIHIHYGVCSNNALIWVFGLSYFVCKRLIHALFNNRFSRQSNTNKPWEHSFVTVFRN